MGVNVDEQYSVGFGRVKQPRPGESRVLQAQHLTGLYIHDLQWQHGVARAGREDRRHG